MQKYIPLEKWIPPWGISIFCPGRGFSRVNTVGCLLVGRVLDNAEHAPSSLYSGSGTHWTSGLYDLIATLSPPCWPLNRNRMVY